MQLFGWMYWDAELHNWRPIPIPTIQVSSLEAFERESDPALTKCRPCSEDSHAECEGPKLCGCSLCNQIAPLVHDLEVDWDWRDRAKTWPD